MKNEKYDMAYIQSHDIDWFCVIDDVPVHVASAGGAIPDNLNNREKLREQQYEVYNLPDIVSDNEIDINYPFLFQHLGIQPEDDLAVQDYLNSFLAMARKGFASYDRRDINDLNAEEYICVCKPNNNQTINLDIPRINSKGRLSMNLEQQMLGINIVKIVDDAE